jgi:hypothetical protein
MNPFRFSISTFLIVVTLLGCGLAAMASQSRFATSFAYSAFLVLICLAMAGAILGNSPHRAFWLGFAIFGWTYWFVEFDSAGGVSQPATPVAFTLLTRMAINVNQPAPQQRAGLLTGELMELLESRMTANRQVGSKVVAQWRGGTYYSGTIIEVNDGLYLIDWDDGSADQWTPPSQILPNSPNLRLAGHATLGGLFALLGGVLVAVFFGDRFARQPPGKASESAEGSPRM